MKKMVLAGIIGLCAAAVPMQSASATLINFDDGSNGASVGAAYAGLGVTFSNATYGDFGPLAGESSPLNIYSTSAGTAFGLANAIVGTFTGTASSVGIRGLDVGSAGMQLNVYDASDVLIGSAQFFGVGLGIGTFHDLNVSVSGIKSFKLFQAAPNGSDGMAFDNLSFDPEAAVPEASTWAMMIAGFAMAGAALRRRSTSVRYA